MIRCASVAAQLISETRSALESAGEWASFQGDKHLGRWFGDHWLELLNLFAIFHQTRKKDAIYIHVLPSKLVTQYIMQKYPLEGDSFCKACDRTFAQGRHAVQGRISYPNSCRGWGFSTAFFVFALIHFRG